MALIKFRSIFIIILRDLIQIILVFSVFCSLSVQFLIHSMLFKTLVDVTFLSLKTTLETSVGLCVFLVVCVI